MLSCLECLHICQFSVLRTIILNTVFVHGICKVFPMATHAQNSKTSKIVSNSSVHRKTAFQRMKEKSRKGLLIGSAALALTLSQPAINSTAEALLGSKAKTGQLFAQTKTEDLPVIPKSQVMEWVEAAKQHEKSQEVDWKESTQDYAVSNARYLRSQGYTIEESVALLKLNVNGKIIYGSLALDLSSELNKLGIKQFSSKAHVEYGGYKMRPEDKEMCHFFYIWDVGAKGFIEKSFPGKFTPESNIGTAVVAFKNSTIKEDYQFMMVDWLGKSKYGFALYPGTGAKEVGTYFSGKSNNEAIVHPLKDFDSKLGVSTNIEKPLLGFFPENSNFTDQLILYFPDSNKLSAIPFTGNLGGFAIVSPR